MKPRFVLNINIERSAIEVSIAIVDVHIGWSGKSHTTLVSFPSNLYEILYVGCTLNLHTLVVNSTYFYG